MHDFVPLVEPDDLPADLRGQWERTTRGGSRDSIRLMANAPDHFRRYNDAYLGLRFDNHLGPRLTEILRLAVATNTRCPVCLAGRVRAATEAGVDEELIACIPGGDDERFSDAERVALAFTRKLVADHLTIDDTDRAAMRAHFTPAQILEISLLAILCSAGRIATVCGIEDY
jgi:AhpD family alkylhydroperoxidase